MASLDLTAQFDGMFGTKPRVFAAPGRVNLIGEHTDYNAGFVMPCALGFSTRVAVAPRLDRQLVIRSEEFPEQFEFSLDALPSRRTGAWCDYVLGIAVVLQQTGYPVPAANILVRGEVPIGAGLSSSAAIEVATALALVSLNETSFPLVEIAKLCQRAEDCNYCSRAHA